MRSAQTANISLLREDNARAGGFHRRSLLLQPQSEREKTPRSRLMDSVFHALHHHLAAAATPQPLSCSTKRHHQTVRLSACCTVKHTTYALTSRCLLTNADAHRPESFRSGLWAAQLHLTATRRFLHFSSFCQPNKNRTIISFIGGLEIGLLHSE
jgi:hypothetical protein